MTLNDGKQLSRSVAEKCRFVRDCSGHGAFMSRVNQV